MEIFRQWGIEDDVTSAGLPREATEFFYLGETLLAREFQRFDRTALGRVDSPSPTERLICAQDLVETILLRRARALGAEVRFDTEVVAVAPIEIGRGERLWTSHEDLLDRFHLESVPSPSGVTHLLFWRR